jgi:hypothetical protein
MTASTAPCTTVLASATLARVVRGREWWAQKPPGSALTGHPSLPPRSRCWPSPESQIPSGGAAMSDDRLARLLNSSVSLDAPTTRLPLPIFGGGRRTVPSRR